MIRIIKESKLNEEQDGFVKDYRGYTISKEGSRYVVTDGRGKTISNSFLSPIGAQAEIDARVDNTYDASEEFYVALSAAYVRASDYVDVTPEDIDKAVKRFKSTRFGR